MRVCSLLSSPPLVDPDRTRHEGTWQQAIDRLTELGIPPIPRPVPDVRVPSGWPRWNKNIANGTWSVPVQ
jgi:hypothetical protein